MHRLMCFFVAATILTSCQTATQQVADEQEGGETVASRSTTSTSSERETERQELAGADSDRASAESPHVDDETTANDTSEGSAGGALVVFEGEEEDSEIGTLNSGGIGNSNGALGARRGSGERSSGGYGELHEQSEEESKPTSRQTSVIPGTPRVHGNLEPEIIQRVMRRYRGQLRDCYEATLAGGDTFSGRLVVAATISSTGEILENRIASADFERQELDECVLEKLRDWNFPEPHGGGIARFECPILFQLD
jgi:hypothetical protein